MRAGTNVLRDQEYRATAQPKLVAIGPAAYLSIEGKGGPRTDGIPAAARLLEAVVERLHDIRSASGADFALPFLEARFWPGAERGSHQGRWQLLLRVPDAVREADVRLARKQLRRGRAQASDVQLITLHEGLCLQALRSPEAGDPERALLDAASQRKLEQAGPRHEIYLGRSPYATWPVAVIVRLPVKALHVAVHVARPRAWRRVRMRGVPASWRHRQVVH